MGEQKTILIVDDEQPILNFMQHVLKPAGYHVLTADNGIAALALDNLHREPIHLLITDIQMPGMNGKELADAICRNRPKLKILFISGFTDLPLEELNPRHRVKGHILSKPFSPAELAAKVGEILAME